MPDKRILVVDDEPIDLNGISESLASEPYRLDLVSSGEAAWEKLQQDQDGYHLIILDRMMPGMGGMELLHRIKQMERYRRVPVIMETAAATPEQASEGLRAGAYYYLTKPYEPEALSLIVRAAIQDFCSWDELAQSSKLHSEMQRLLSVAEYRFATLQEARRLAAALAELCPSPLSVGMGLQELLVNAIEHGNLGIGYQEKTLLVEEGRWEEEVHQRLMQAQFRDRRATVRAERLEQEIVFTVVDQGPGFDWRGYLDFDSERMLDPNGRGIAMAKQLSFSRLEYHGNGNTVAAAVALELDGSAYRFAAANQ